MSALHQFKQKGRTLRKFLAQAFNTEVKLTLAYEAIATMEGSATWNEFSARLVDAKSAAVVQDVLDTDLGKPENAELLLKVCQTAWENAVSDWKHAALKGHCDFIIESSNIFAALNACDVASTGEEGFEDEVAEFVENTMQDLGYFRLATLVSVGHVAQFGSRGSLEETLLGVVPFSSLNEGDEFRDVDLGELYRKESVHRAQIVDYRDGEFKGEVVFFPNDFMVHSCKRSEAPETVYATMQMFEVMMQDVVGDYEVPEEIPEWQWVQQNAAFSHLRNNQDGIWEFMVAVESFADSDDIPDKLKALFKKARHHKAAWIMFHQGT